MAKSGRRYPLVVYTHTINRWWPAIFTLGVAMIGLAWGIYRWGFEQWRWLTFASIGGFFVLFGIFLWLIRNSAYVQPFKDYLRIATPFLRLNVSYKRIRRASSAHMGTLFPPNSVSRSHLDIMQSLSRMTALVIELSAFPMSQPMLKFFFSPLFFKDKTPHFVILVSDWMRFSSELESYRTGEITSSAPQHKRDISILSKLPKK
jgi:hypothetical protein